jgi:hypothetical protein
MKSFIRKILKRGIGIPAIAISKPKESAADRIDRTCPDCVSYSELMQLF